MVGFSLEIFPPKADVGIESVYKPLEGLCQTEPDYISVTYSAGGSGIGLTDEVCEFIQKNHGIVSVAHLTCANTTKKFVKDYLLRLENRGIKNILALRGDLNSDRILTDYTFATDLIKDIKENGNFGIMAACYPEGYKDSVSFEHDIKIMKLKEDLGATHFISQLFFDNADFYNMVEKARNFGVKSEISAGIMPVTNAKQIVRMVQLSGAKIPPELAKLIAKYEFDPAGMREAGIDFSIEQSINLIENGVDAIHLYAMNNAENTRKFYNGVKSALGR